MNIDKCHNKSTVIQYSITAKTDYKIKKSHPVMAKEEKDLNQLR